MLSFVLFSVIVPLSNAQMADKGWKNTVTLPSGEVILDMTGDWDQVGEGCGVFSWYKGSPEILTITQKGNAFTAVKQIGSKWVPKCAETIKGELDKHGFKVVYSYIASEAMDGSFDWEECKWEISERGNKVDLDCGERIKTTFTRR